MMAQLKPIYHACLDLSSYHFFILRYQIKSRTFYSLQIIFDDKRSINSNMPRRDDDFVLTISDDDAAIPGLVSDASSSPSPSPEPNIPATDTLPQQAKPSGKKRKQSLTVENPVKKRKDERIEDEHIDSDFEFKPGGALDDAVVAGFDDWEVPKVKLDQAKKIPLGVDDIIARRKKREQEAIFEEEEEGIGQDDEPLPQVDDEELLADDVFGLGVAPEHNEEDAEDEEDEGQEEVDEKIDDDQQDKGSDEDDDEYAAPVAHPDDQDFDLTPLQADEERPLNPAELARRDAFFAPEDKTEQQSQTFQSLSLSRPILRGLTSLGFTAPTPIQAKAIPVALLGKDVVGGAETGSGKTGAFIIPILERLLYRPKKFPTTRVAVLMPTRELAAQCFAVAAKIAQFTDITFALLVGGLSLREQEATLKRRPDVVIATPGRFIDHMRNSASFVVEALEILVLDEADRMLEDGFADELNEIIATIPRSRQTMLFSATMTSSVDALIRTGLTRPVRLMIDATRRTVSSLVQEFIKLKPPPSNPTDPDTLRLAYLLHLCTTTYTSQTIIFLPTKTLTHRAKILLSLPPHSLTVTELHGSMPQESRLSSIAAFRTGAATHLLATDLASRGLDIPRVATVLNLSVPNSPTTYLHRVGRTARAGRDGVAATLFSSAKPAASAPKTAKSERALLRPILRLARQGESALRTRSVAGPDVAKALETVQRLGGEMDSIMAEEREEKALAMTEREIARAENVERFKDEIGARPARTWFQGEREKLASKRAGGAQFARTEKKKLSGKEKKGLDRKGERVNGSGAGWKKGREERMGGGVLKKGKEAKGVKKRAARSDDKSGGENGEARGRGVKAGLGRGITSSSRGRGGRGASRGRGK